MGSIDTINGRLRPDSPADSPVKRIALSLVRAAGLLEGMLEKRRSRRALLEMSDEQLKDIGISRADAFGEAARPFWD